MRNLELERKVERLRARLDALTAQRRPAVAQINPKQPSFKTPWKLSRFPRLTLHRDAFLLGLLALIVFDLGRGQLELLPYRYVASTLDPGQNAVAGDTASVYFADYGGRASSASTFGSAPILSIGLMSDEVPQIERTGPSSRLADIELNEIQLVQAPRSQSRGIDAIMRSDRRISTTTPVLYETFISTQTPAVDQTSPQFMDLDYEVVGLVDKSRQRIKIFRQGVEIYEWQVSTARRGKTTPTGTWTAQWLSKDHKSSLYNNAPMPYSIFFNGHYAIHGTDALDRLGTPASAGCVRLHPDNARTLFTMVQDVGKSNFAVRIIE